MGLREILGLAPKKTIEHLDFIIAGVQKGGTSALHWFFDKHPNITMGHPEEAHMVNHPHRHFFDDEKRFANPPVDHDFLHRGIKFKRESRVTGSVTPIYTYWRPAMERIHSYHPGIKLIVLLRNPMDRAFSHWNMERDFRIRLPQLSMGMSNDYEVAIEEGATLVRVGTAIFGERPRAKNVRAAEFSMGE